MDPNAALYSLLSGHMMFDHAEALSGWLRSGGFAPDHVLLPVDCHEAYADYCHGEFGTCRGIHAMADARGVHLRRGADGDWRLVFNYEELAQLPDSII